MTHAQAQALRVAQLQAPFASNARPGRHGLSNAVYESHVRSSAPLVQSSQPLRPAPEKLHEILKTQDKPATDRLPRNEVQPIQRSKGESLHQRVVSTTSRVGLQPQDGKQPLAPRRVQDPQQQVFPPMPMESASQGAQVPGSKRKHTIDMEASEVGEVSTKRAKHTAEDPSNEPSRSKSQAYASKRPQTGSTNTQSLPFSGQHEAHFASVFEASSTDQEPTDEPPLNGLSLNAFQPAVTATAVPHQPAASSRSARLEAAVESRLTTSLNDTTEQNDAAHSPKRMRVEMTREPRLSTGSPKRIGITEPSNEPEPEISIDIASWMLIPAGTLRSMLRPEDLADFLSHKQLIRKGMADLSDLKMSRYIAAAPGRREFERRVFQQMVALLNARGVEGSVDMGDNNGLAEMIACEDELRTKFEEYALYEPSDHYLDACAPMSEHGGYVYEQALFGEHTGGK
jgi:hypothetical protein